MPKRTADQLPSHDRAEEGARAAIANARSLYECHRLILEAGQLGPAASLAVLAGEEAVKAFALAIHSLGVEEPSTDLDKLLFQHTVRHNLATISTVWTWVTADLIQRLEHVASAHADHGLEEYRAARMRAISQHGVFLKNAISGKSANPVTSWLDWWQRANVVKNAGLYVDFVAGVWRTPSDTARSEAELAGSAVEAFLQIADAAVTGLLEMEPDERDRAAKSLREFMQNWTAEQEA